jgi:hypothetical protein
MIELASYTAGSGSGSKTTPERLAKPGTFSLLVRAGSSPVSLLPRRSPSGLSPHALSELSRMIVPVHTIVSTWESMKHSFVNHLWATSPLVGTRS